MKTPKFKVTALRDDVELELNANRETWTQQFKLSDARKLALALIVAAARCEGK
jgi:hypothetical protein